MDLVTRIFCDPGDVVICEAPSYVGALGVFRAYECDVVHVEMDEHGLVPRPSSDAIATCQAQGRRIKFLYTIPNYHNPAGVTLSAERRTEVLEHLPRRRRAGARGQPLRPARLRRRADPRDAGRRGRGRDLPRVVLEDLRPGFRVGWVLAPHAVREKLVLAQESATLCPPAFSQMAVSAYLDKHDWLGQIKQFREMYRERRDAMVGALDDLMPPAARWNVPAAASTSGSPCPTGSTPRRCCRAR